MKKVALFFLILIFITFGLNVAYSDQISKNNDLMFKLPDTIDFVIPNSRDTEINDSDSCRTFDYTCSFPTYVWQFGPASPYEQSGYATRFTPAEIDTIKWIEIAFYQPGFLGTPDVEVFICPSIDGFPDMANIDHTVTLTTENQIWPSHIDLIGDEGVELIYNGDYFIGVRLVNALADDASAIISDDENVCGIPTRRSYIHYEDEWILMNDLFGAEFNWFISCYSCPRSVKTLHVSTEGDDINGDGTISNPYATIQKGLDLADEYDSVIVAQGTYTGEGNRDIDFGGKNIYLKSENGPEVTIIDCDGTAQESHRGFYFHSGETPLAVVSGFTIKNGLSVFYGGAIYLVNSSPTIDNNILDGNTSNSFVVTTPPLSDGGGIYCYNSNSIISNNTIKNNYATASGGGISCSHSNPTISNNIFGDNTAHNGGSISLYLSNAIINNNLIYKNYVFRSWMDYPYPPMWIGGTGGGISCSNSNPTLVGNTIIDNIAEEKGGGVYFLGSNPDIMNCIIWGNTAPYAPSIFPEPYYSAFCSDIEGGWIGSNDNIDINPLFCGPEIGDYSIGSQSNCAAANNSCNVLIGALDIGCTHPLLCADLNYDGGITVADIVFIVDYYFNGGQPPPQTYNGDINCDGSVNLTDILFLNQYVLHNGTADCCQ